MFETGKSTTSVDSPKTLEEINMTYKSTIGEKFTTSIRHYVHTDGARKPLVLFVHGYFDSKDAAIGNDILEYCKKNALDYFAFDGLGFGDSKADMASITFSDRINQIKELFEEYLIKGYGYTQVTLVGFSMGGFISFGAARDIDSLRKKLTGVLLIAPAVLFSKGDLDFFKPITTPSQQETLDAGGSVDFGGVIFTQAMLDGIRENSPSSMPLANVNFPVKFIWGAEDTDVPHIFSQNVLPFVTPASQVESIIVEGASHLFKRDSDQEIILKKLAELTTTPSS